MDPVEDTLDEKEATSKSRESSHELFSMSDATCSQASREDCSSLSKVYCSSEDELVKIFSQKNEEPSDHVFGDKTSANKTAEIASDIEDNELKDELEQSVFCLEKILSEDDKKNLDHELCEEISDDPYSTSDGNAFSEAETSESIVESDEDSNDNINLNSGNILKAIEVSHKLNDCIDQALHDQLIGEFEVIEKEVNEENNQLLEHNLNYDVNNTMDSRESDWETEEEILVTGVDDEEVNKMEEEMISKSLLLELEEQEVDIEDERKTLNEEAFNWNSTEADMNAILNQIIHSMPKEEIQPHPTTLDQTSLFTPTFNLKTSSPSTSFNEELQMTTTINDEEETTAPSTLLTPTPNLQQIPENDLCMIPICNITNEEEVKEVERGEDYLIEEGEDAIAPDIIIKVERAEATSVNEDKSTPATPSSTPTRCVQEIQKTDLLLTLLNSVKEKAEEEEKVCDSNCETSIDSIKSSDSEFINETELTPLESYTEDKLTPDTPTSTPIKCVSDVLKSDVLTSLLSNIKNKKDEEEINHDNIKNDVGGNVSSEMVISDEIAMKLPVEDENEREVIVDELDHEITNTDACQGDFEENSTVSLPVDDNEVPELNEELNDKSNFEADPLENIMVKSVQSDILKKMIVKETNILHSSTEKLDIDSSNESNDNKNPKMACNFLKPKILIEPEISDCSDFADERKIQSKPTKTKRKKGKKTKNRNKPDLSRENLARIMLPMRMECEESEILQELLTPVYSSQESLYSSQSSLQVTPSRTPKSTSQQNLHLNPSSDFVSQHTLDMAEVSDLGGNIETIESLRLPNEDPVPCEPLASLSLEGKMSVPGGAWFPWKTLSFLLLIATAAIINIDVNKHGNFKRSNTGQFMKDIGQYDRTMAAYQLASTSAISATIMAKEYGNQGYSMARKHAGPTMDVMAAKANEASGLAIKYGQAGLENAREMVKAGVDKVGVMLPGLEDQAKVYWAATKDLAIKGANAASQGWKEVTSGNVEIDWDGLKSGAIEKAVYLQKQLEQVLQWSKDQINTLVK